MYAISFILSKANSIQTAHVLCLFRSSYHRHTHTHCFNAVASSGTLILTSLDLYMRVCVCVCILQSCPNCGCDSIETDSFT